MSEDAQARSRTGTRLRAEVLPGLSHGEELRQAIGRYEIVKTIGKGAMGVVYKARDPLLDRVVAVKTITSPQQQGRRVRSAFIERFQREAKAAAKMSHPAIVTIFDVGIDEGSGSPFMVLEYLPGESLADRLDRVRLPLSRCVQIGLDLASALSFAHRQRIIHRDVKPANVLHAGDNRWKLADFGIARMPDSDLTQVGIFMGTPGYSPPEAIREGRYTPQADVFAWGSVMYELLSGRIPYEGPDTKTTNGYVLLGNAPSPMRHDPSIPEPLAAVVMSAIEPSDQRRFKDASEVEHALREAWDRCLMHGIIHPAVLALDEAPHDAAPVRMHEPKVPPAGPAPVPAPAPAADLSLGGIAEFADSQEITAIAKAPEMPPPLIVESTQRGIDNDPTTLISLRPSGPQVEPTGSASVRGTPDEGVPRLKERNAPSRSSKAALVAPGGTSTLAQRHSAEAIARPPWWRGDAPRPYLVLLAVVLFIGAVALGLYLGGVVG